MCQIEVAHCGGTAVGSAEGSRIKGARVEPESERACNLCRVNWQRYTRQSIQPGNAFGRPQTKEQRQLPGTQHRSCSCTWLAENPGSDRDMFMQDRCEGRDTGSDGQACLDADSGPRAAGRSIAHLDPPSAGFEAREAAAFPCGCDWGAPRTMPAPLQHPSDPAGCCSAPAAAPPPANRSPGREHRPAFAKLEAQNQPIAGARPLCRRSPKPPATTCAAQILQVVCMDLQQFVFLTLHPPSRPRTPRRTSRRAGAQTNHRREMRRTNSRRRGPACPGTCHPPRPLPREPP